ncbi:MAG: HAD-IC family P-type ATPase [bacterium]|nr:HAD-IC family P-type ATPase [bacterium]
MAKELIVQDSFLIAGIMCHQGCGLTLQNCVNRCLDECKNLSLLPNDAYLTIDSEPQTLGVHRLFITIEAEKNTLNNTRYDTQLITKQLRNAVDAIGFEVITDPTQEQRSPQSRINWQNILINGVSIILVIALSVLFPPSGLLTLGLTFLTGLTTAFTAREYLIQFFRNVQNKAFANMTSTVFLGWLLSTAHTVYHSFSMPLTHSIAMTFMSFIMPILLITLINAMDEVKRLVLNKSKTMHLQGMNTLFPQMADNYICYELPPEKLNKLMQLIELGNNEATLKMKLQCAALVTSNPFFIERKSALKKGMIVHVKRGECFPIDCILMDGSTLVDASLLTGEAQQRKNCLDFIPAGAINLSHDVTVYAVNNAYNSTVNKIVFRSNRAKETIKTASKSQFTLFYLALIILALAASVFIPLSLGILTLPLLLQNVTGILFGICPCTIAIAHEFPTLLSIHQRSNKKIIFRDAHLSGESTEIHTVVFDKTGTLTTGISEVACYEGISSSLWQRIYLLEKHSGGEHPLATAITHYYEQKIAQYSIIKDVNKASIDANHRGLTAFVQGQQIHIGNLAYLEQEGVVLPRVNLDKVAQGFSPVYVAENKSYQGVIYIRHEVRKELLSALARLKQEGKKIIMLTGDTQLAALSFNQQNDALFAAEDIYATQTPVDKEAFMRQLMSSPQINPKGVWFIGDGLNDAPCARIVSEKGGVSCAMTADTKASFFTDISLNGSLNYLFAHHKLTQILQKIKWQNQGLLIYSALAFLAFILSFSVIGIAVSPIIPLIIMATTTVFILFNSYRMQLAVDLALDKNISWIKTFFASDFSISLGVVSSFLLMTGLIIASLSAGALVVPTLVFSAGTLAAVSSAIMLVGSIGVVLLLLLAIGFVCSNTQEQTAEDLKGAAVNLNPILENQDSLTIVPATSLFRSGFKANEANPGLNEIQEQPEEQFSMS